MQTKSGSGFDAAKFQKLVAMFDSPYAEEAATAFRLALAELKKNQLKFIDQMGNTAEAEKAKKECDAVRRELFRALDLCKSKEAKTAELEGIIERLHRRIAMMEEAAAAPPMEPVDDAPQVETPEPSEFGWGGQAFTETPGPSSREAPALSHWKQFFWCGLVILGLCYVAALCLLGHPVTVANWRDAKALWFFWAVVLPTGGYLLRMIAIDATSDHPKLDNWLITKLHFPVGLFAKFERWRVFQFGPRCAAWMDRPTSTVKAFYAALILMFFSYMPPLYGLPDNPKADPDPVAIAICTFLMLSGCVWIIRQTFQKYSWRGISFKLCMVVDTMLIALTISFGRDPWSFAIYNRPLWTPHLGYGAFIGTIFLVVTFLLPERTMHWIMDERDPGRWVVLPAVGSAMLTVFVFIDRVIDHHMARTHAALSAVSQLIAPAVVHASDGSAGSPESGGSVWIIGPILFVLFFLFLGSRSRARQRKAITKAQQAAHTFQAPNVHGDAGYASKADARRKGWI